MKYLTIELIKAQLRINHDYEDELLTLYGNSAERTVCLRLNRGKTVDKVYDSLVAEYGDFPTDLLHATLMLVDVSYQYRSMVSPTNVSMVPYTFDSICEQYVLLAGINGEDENRE